MTNAKDDRDATIDRLLAVSPKLVSGGPGEGGAQHLDADTLAAWADNALGPGELAAAEAHAAGCARCQAMLAAMAKTAPLPAAAAAPWWTASFRWLVPLTATAAAAGLVWVLVPARGTTVRQVTQIADSTPLASPPSLAAPPSPSAPAAADRERRAQAPAEAKELESSRQAANSAVDLSRRSADSAKAEREADKKSEPPPNAPARTNLRLEDAQAAAQERAAAPAATAAKAAAAPPPAAAPAAPLAGVAARTFSFGAPETVIVSSNPASRWRILQGGAVQRSADGGATWQMQNTGVTETLTAGASPSPSVCWLVGPRGIVLLSTDGRSWKRLAFPESVQLASVSATDSEIATVTTADGRQFVTDDSGRTWTVARH